MNKDELVDEILRLLPSEDGIDALTRRTRVEQLSTSELEKMYIHLDSLVERRSTDNRDRIVWEASKKRAKNISTLEHLLRSWETVNETSNLFLQTASQPFDARSNAISVHHLRQYIDLGSGLYERFSMPIAIFGPDKRLYYYNSAYSKLWNFEAAFLDRHPTDEEILDRLNEEHKVPEQHDYQAWKCARLGLYDQLGENLPEEFWHVPGGRTLRVVAQPNPFGGLTYFFEDATEKIALESSHNKPVNAQSAVIDTLQEAVAVIGPDGTLKLYNTAFANLWELEPSTLLGEPHIQRIAEACIARFGDGHEWQRLVASISSGSERRRDWGEMERNDKTILALSLAPLADGATLLTFADVTDRFRIESALRDRNEALEAADQLKSDFIHHASFLFRDPLNAVHGFADLLSSGHVGALTDRQKEYVGNILRASNKLAEVTSDILDLAMIDSGAMRLELARIDLYELLSRAAEPLKPHAANLEIKYALDCPRNIGVAIVDQRRIRQVIFNLLSNAFKYTPRGGAVTLGANIEGEDVQIYVSDTGPGIAPEVRAKVFKRFTAKGHGDQTDAGLGLGLVNRFIQLHDGWVEIESHGDSGTVVTCHIPRRLEGDTQTPEFGSPQVSRKIA